MADQEESLQELIEYKELDPLKTRFQSDANGFLTLELDGTQYHKISLVRLLPFLSPDEYLSCLSEEKEIGIIRRIADFPAEQQKILQDHLFFRYYSLKIERILSIREKMWFLFMKVIIDGETRELCLRDLYNNMKYYNANDVILIDIEENRYIIENFRSLPKKYLQKLEIYL